MTQAEIVYYHDRGSTVDQLVTNGATIAQLINAGITLAEVLESNQPIKDIKESKNYSIVKLLDATKKDRFGVTRLNKNLYLSVMSKLISEKVCTINDLITAGATITECRQAGVTLQMMIDAKVSTDEIKAAGFSIGQILNAYTAESTQKLSVMTSLRNSGTTFKQLYESGCSISELISIGCNLSDLLKAEVPVSLLLSHGFTLKEVISAKASIASLLGAGYTTQQILQGATVGVSNSLQRTAIRASLIYRMVLDGISVTQLATDGVTLAEFVGAGVSLKLLLEAGYTVAELKALGVTTKAILKANAEPGILSSIVESGAYTLDDYINSFLSKSNQTTLTNYGIFDNVKDWLKEQDSITIIQELIRIEYIMNTAQEDRYGEPNPDKILIQLIGDIKNAEETAQEATTALNTANNEVIEKTNNLRRTCMHGFVSDFLKYASDPKRYHFVDNLSQVTCVICGATIPSASAALDTMRSIVQTIDNSDFIERLKMVGVFTHKEVERFYSYRDFFNSGANKLEKWIKKKTKKTPTSV